MAKGHRAGKKKTPHGQGTRTGRITSPGIMNQLVTGHPPVPLCCYARAPEPADMQHPPFTPAHEFFFLLNMLWSRHVKPSPAKGEKSERSGINFTPAHEAIIGPNYNLTIGLEMDATAAPTTGSLQPRVVSAQSTLPLSLVPVAFAVKAVLSLLLASRQRRVDPYLLAPPRMRCLVNKSLMQDRRITLCNSNLGEPA